jgi:hypothetical protein
MSKGYNKADKFEKALQNLYFILNEDKTVRPCVFLSHKKEDKPDCKIIADYFSNAEIDYYLDELDESLQAAVVAGDPKLITESIKKGIRESSHMLVVVSEKTFKSQWVPFEIGYGHSAILDKSTDEGIHDDKIKLAILVLKDLSEKELPDFMQMAHIIRGTKSLNEYITSLSGKLEKSLITEKLLFSHSDSKHPLDSVLNWKL